MKRKKFSDKCAPFTQEPPVTTSGRRVSEAVLCFAQKHLCGRDCDIEDRKEEQWLMLHAQLLQPVMAEETGVKRVSMS